MKLVDIRDGHTEHKKVPCFTSKCGRIHFYATPLNTEMSLVMASSRFVEHGDGMIQVFNPDQVRILANGAYSMLSAIQLAAMYAHE